MRRFYALIRLSYGEPASPAKAAELEIDWWRVHRQVQYSVPGVTSEDLVESVTRLYCYLFGEPEATVRPAAVHRVRAMGLSDQWVREGCPYDSPLLPLVHAALVHSYAALLAAVHHLTAPSGCPAHRADEHRGNTGPPRKLLSDTP